MHLETDDLGKTAKVAGIETDGRLTVSSLVTAGITIVPEVVMVSPAEMTYSVVVSTTMVIDDCGTVIDVGVGLIGNEPGVYDKVMVWVVPDNGVKTEAI